MSPEILWPLLARASGLTVERVQAAAALAGGVENIGSLSTSDLAAAGWPPCGVVAFGVHARNEAERDLVWLARSDVELLPYTSPRYPPLLAQIPGAPAVLYVRGSLATLAHPSQLAIVGSRRPTPQGRRTAHRFAAALVRSGLVVTSGLALGIDAASHRGALSGGGLTVAVCGTGLDQMYPAEHTELADQIVANGGALVSEFPPRSEPLPSRFPQRNRLISGLSLGVLVVEAARQSGSLITARHAGDQGREVFAMPGSIHSPVSQGCHQLLRAGAKLVENVEDVLAELNLPNMNQSLTRTPEAAAHRPVAGCGLDKPSEILLDALGFEPTRVDDLALRAGMPSESVASMLLILELQGLVEPHPGGRYGRVP